MGETKVRPQQYMKTMIATYNGSNPWAEKKDIFQLEIIFGCYSVDTVYNYYFFCLI